MNAQKIAILTDTGTNTPAEIVERYDIRIAPLRISFADGSTYDSEVDITAAELVERLKVEVPKTSLPSPQTVRDLLEQARADGYESAVFVTISSGLSATYQTVKLVAEQMEDFPVEVVDSLSIGVAAGMVVIAAAEMIDEGVPFAQLGSRLERLVRVTWVYFSTKTLEFLRKGGRISEAVYRLGSMLDVKPVITCNEAGHYVVARKARGWERSLSAELALIRGRAAGAKLVRLCICCSASCECFDEMEERLRAEMSELGVEIERVIRCGFSPDLLVHTGPDAVGLAIQIRA